MPYPNPDDLLTPPRPTMPGAAPAPTTPATPPTPTMPAPAPAPAAPTPATGAPPAAPAAPAAPKPPGGGGGAGLMTASQDEGPGGGGDEGGGGGDSGGGGGGGGEQTEEQQVAQQPAGTYEDDSSDAGNANTGDPYIDELRSGKYAGSEDWRRFSNAQLKAWQKYYIGGGKFKNIYGDIVDKPPDRGPNTPEGYNGLGEKGGFGGGGGGGRGGGYGGVMGYGNIQSNELWKAILARLKGPSRYSPEVMSQLMSGVKNTAEAQASNQKQEALAQAAASGMARSPATARLLAGIRANTYGQMLGAQTEFTKAKIEADFNDKNEAIKEGMDWLNSLRSFVASTYATDAQKAAAFANIDLGYARLNQEQNMMREQYAQQLSLMGLG